MDDDFGGSIALGNVDDAFSSFPSQTTVLADQSPTLGLLFRTSLPPLETAITRGEDGQDESGGSGKFDTSRCAADLGPNEVEVMVVEDHQRVLFRLDGHFD